MGFYAQRPMKSITENRLFLSGLVYEVKHFFKPHPMGGFEGVGGKRGVWQEFPLNKNLCIG